VLRVAIIGPSQRFLSGVSYYTIRLSNALATHAHVKTILFRNMLPKKLFPGWKRVGKRLSSIDFDENVEVYELLDWNNPLTWTRAVDIICDCDVLILEWWTSSVAHMYVFIQLMNKLRKRKPVVVEYHEVVDPLESSILPIKIYAKVAGKIIRRLADRYVVHSKADRKLISKHYDIPKDRIEVIPHGIYDHYERLDKENARRMLKIEEDFVILFFGLLRPYKGVRYLIKAFENLPDDVVRGCRLMIVGEAWEDRESLKLAKNSKLSDRISVINEYVPDSEVSVYFSASDVVVLPYTRASQSGVAHIAMAFGLPVIATRVGGLVESLSKYEGTIFVEPRDIDGLAEAILKVYYNRGRSYEIPSDLRWNNIAKRWIKFLEKCLLSEG
jgi:glycosyltransferase involved in cell wall biosynthesis